MLGSASGARGSGEGQVEASTEKRSGTVRRCGAVHPNRRGGPFCGANHRSLSDVLAIRGRAEPGVSPRHGVHHHCGEHRRHWNLGLRRKPLHEPRSTAGKATASRRASGGSTGCRSRSRCPPSSCSHRRRPAIRRASRCSVPRLAAAAFRAPRSTSCRSTARPRPCRSRRRAAGTPSWPAGEGRRSRRSRPSCHRTGAASSDRIARARREGVVVCMRVRSRAAHEVRSARRGSCVGAYRPVQCHPPSRPGHPSALRNAAISQARRHGPSPALSAPMRTSTPGSTLP